MLWQRLIVALLVLSAATFSAWRLMPLRRRVWLLERLTSERARGGGIVGWLWRSTLAQSGKGCNACVSGAPKTQSAAPASAAGRPTRTSAGLRR